MTANAPKKLTSKEIAGIVNEIVEKACDRFGDDPAAIVVNKDLSLDICENAAFYRKGRERIGLITWDKQGPTQGQVDKLHTLVAKFYWKLGMYGEVDYGEAKRTGKLF